MYIYIYIYIDYSGVSDIGEQILIIQALLIVVDFVCFDFQRFSTNGSVYSKPEKTQKKNKQFIHGYDQSPGQLVTTIPQLFYQTWNPKMSKKPWSEPFLSCFSMRFQGFQEGNWVQRKLFFYFCCGSTWLIGLGNSIHSSSLPHIL